MQLLGRSVETHQTISIGIERDRIVLVRPIPISADGLPWLMPGLVDLQVNGYGGVEFSDESLTPQQVVTIAEQVSRGGVSHFCPTLTTNSESALCAALAAIDAACRADRAVAMRIPGVHLEGPYISAADGPRGAHPRRHVRAPDWDQFRRFQDAAGGRIRLITLSPEYDESPSFIRHAVDAGVTVALGHLDATAAQIQAAVDAGARLSTHLGNGCHAQLPRHPNYLWDQLAEDRLLASLIVDGHHLPSSVVKSLVRAKGIERIILVSDLAGSAGLQPGRYETSGGPVEMLADGRLMVAGQDVYLAGATCPLIDCLANAVSMAGIGWGDAIRMASTLPAELLGLEPARLEDGAPAHVTLCAESPSGRLQVVQTIVAGQVV